MDGFTTSTTVGIALRFLYCYIYGLHQYRGGGTGPADLATARPKLDRNPQFKIFHCYLDTLTVLINNESMIKTTS